MKRKGQAIEEIIDREYKKAKTMNENVQISTFPKFYNDLSKEICFSFMQEMNCYVCDKSFPSQEDYVNCFHCSKLYHKHCHSKSEFFEGKCKFCVNK
jgi:hypothetical protein